MTTRLLPSDEWAKLAITEVGPVWSWLPPNARVVVVEDEEQQLMGCHVLLPVWHLEGLWIAPDHRRRTSVARRLWSRVQQEARSLGVTQLVTAAADDTVKGLLTHVGAIPLPDHFVVTLCH